MSSIDKKSLDETARTPLDEIDFALIARTIWGGKLLILICGIIGLLGGGYYAYRVAEPIYAATTVVEFSPKENNLLDLNSIVSGTISDLSTVNTTLEFLQSRSLAEEVVTQLNLLEDPEFNAAIRPAVRSLRGIVKGALVQAGVFQQAEPLSPEEQINRIFRNTTAALRNAYAVSHIRETHLLTITARASGGSKAADLANTLADVFLEAERQKIFESTQAAINWLSAELLKIETQLKQLEDELAAQKLSSGVATQESLEGLAVQLTDMRLRETRRQAELDTAQLTLTDMVQAVESRDKTAILTAFNDPLLRRLSSTVGPTVTARDAAFLERAETVLQTQRQAITRSQQDLGLITDAAERLRISLEEQNRDLQKLVQLEQEVTVTRDLYGTFLTGLQEATVQIGLVRNDKRIMTKALSPVRPESPRRLRLTAGFAVLGGLAATLFLLLRLVMNTGALRSSEQLESISGLTVLGEVLAAPVRKRTGVPRYYLDNPTSAAAETLRNLRTSLLMSMPKDAQKTITITSSVPGEGKTTLSLLLASNLANLGRRVLLVEADIRRRTMPEYFEMGEHPHSMAGVMEGSVSLQDAVFHDQALGIDLLTGDEFEENPADLFSSERFRNLIPLLAQHYDHVILDTPPVLVVPDARIIAQQTDGLIFVVRWDSTQVTQVKEGLKQFRDLGIQPNGLVLSNVIPRKMRRYGYSGYGKYGSRYYNTQRRKS